jgi:hypothetical protein
MKKIYSAVLLPFAIIVSSGCSKDILKNYEDRIEGSWRLDDVDRIGFGSSSLPFTEGRFIFSSGGKLEYTDGSGVVFHGSWDMRRHVIRGNCDTDNNGNTQCDDRNVRSLQITAIDFQSQNVRTEHFDEIVFTGTNRFKAYIYLSARTYVFKFRRE